MLVAEYNGFRREADTLIALQSTYTRHIATTRRIFDTALQQKNYILADAFVPVNRNKQHLRDETLRYFKEHHMHEKFREIPSSTWLDYTAQALALIEDETPGRKNTRGRRRHNRRSRSQLTQQSDEAAFAEDVRPATKKIFIWPINRAAVWLSSRFGPRRKANGAWGFHHGLDMAAPRGTPVKAAGDGEVVEVRFDQRYGKTILLEHPNKIHTRYAHLDAILVKAGQHVKAGSLIGRVGATGYVRRMRSDGSHLHFEVSVMGHRTNPMRFLA